MLLPKAPPKSWRTLSGGSEASVKRKDKRVACFFSTHTHTPASFSHPNTHSKRKKKKNDTQAWRARVFVLVGRGPLARTRVEGSSCRPSALGTHAGKPSLQPIFGTLSLSLPLTPTPLSLFLLFFIFPSSPLKTLTPGQTACRPGRWGSARRRRARRRATRPP